MHIASTSTLTGTALCAELLNPDRDRPRPDITWTWVAQAVVLPPFESACEATVYGVS